jgi:hypothetical protein
LKTRYEKALRKLAQREAPQVSFGIAQYCNGKLMLEHSLIPQSFGNPPIKSGGNRFS